MDEDCEILLQLVFLKAGITDGSLFYDVVENDVPMDNLFEAFCSACEATDLHKHRSALYEWLNDQWEDKNAQWYSELQRLAIEAFAEYCKTLNNPSTLTLTGVTHVPQKFHESDEALVAAIKQSTTDESVPTDFTLQFDEAELAEAIRRSLETDAEVE